VIIFSNYIFLIQRIKIEIALLIPLYFLSLNTLAASPVGLIYILKVNLKQPSNSGRKMLKRKIRERTGLYSQHVILPRVMGNLVQKDFLVLPVHFSMLEQGPYSFHTGQWKQILRYNSQQEFLRR